MSISFEEIIISRDELIQFFELGILEDTGHGWIMHDENDPEFYFEVNIIALHKIHPKYIQDPTKADFYKIVPKNRMI